MATTILNSTLTFVILSAFILYAKEDGKAPRVKRGWQEE